MFICTFTSAISPLINKYKGYTKQENQLDKEGKRVNNIPEAGRNFIKLMFANDLNSLYLLMPLSNPLHSPWLG